MKQQSLPRIEQADTSNRLDAETLPVGTNRPNQQPSTVLPSASTEPLAPTDPLDKSIASTSPPASSRFDPIRGRWTIIAGQRGERPMEFCQKIESTRSNLDCPFCAGNESHTPAPVLCIDPTDNLDPTGESSNAVSDSTSSSWLTRVVPNKFPAVTPLNQNTVAAYMDSAANHPLMPERTVIGGHEVIIESARHIRSMSELDIDEVQSVFHAYAKRIRYWKTAGNASYISIFKNVGSDAGASLAHSHSQLIATDLVPDEVQGNYWRMHRHKLRTGCCLQCDLIREEQKRAGRIVIQQNGLIAFCPFASHLPMMMRITTTQHHRCLSELADDKIEQLARLVHRAIGWMETALGDVAYNFVIHCHPKAIDDSVEAFHWSLDLLPRLTKVAGFEWNSGTMINTTPPEKAAAIYREQAESQSPSQWRS